MGRPLLLGGLAAIASAVLFLSLITGAAGAPLFAYFVQLPILFCAMAMGLPIAAGVSMVSIVLTALTSGLVAALVFLIIEAAPALFLARQALLWQQDEAGTIHWYPAGRIVTDLAVAGSALALAGLAWLALGTSSLAQLVDQLVGAMTADAAAGSLLAGARALIVAWAAWLPGLVAASWILMTLLNAALAQALAARSGRALRPSPDIALLMVPGWCALPLMAGVVLGWLAEGWLQAAAGIVALIFALPFLFQGLAVIHALARRRLQGRLPIIAFYLLFVVFSYPLVFLVVGLGLAEEVASIRRRFA